MQLDEDTPTRQAPPPLRLVPEDFTRNRDVEESSESLSSASETSLDSSDSSDSSGSDSSESSSQFSKSGQSSSSTVSRSSKHKPHRHRMMVEKHHMWMQTSDTGPDPIGSSVAPGSHFGFIKNVSRDLNGTTAVIVIRVGRSDQTGIIDVNTKIHLPNSLGTADDIWPNQTISFHIDKKNYVSDMHILAGHWHGLIEEITDNLDGTQTIGGAVHPLDKKKKLTIFQADKFTLHRIENPAEKLFGYNKPIKVGDYVDIFFTFTEKVRYARLIVVVAVGPITSSSSSSSKKHPHSHMMMHNHMGHMKKHHMKNHMKRMKRMHMMSKKHMMKKHHMKKMKHSMKHSMMKKMKHRMKHSMMKKMKHRMKRSGMMMMHMSHSKMKHMKRTMKMKRMSHMMKNRMMKKSKMTKMRMMKSKMSKMHMRMMKKSKMMKMMSMGMMKSHMMKMMMKMMSGSKSGSTPGQGMMKMMMMMKMKMSGMSPMGMTMSKMSKMSKKKMKRESSSESSKSSKSSTVSSKSSTVSSKSSGSASSGSGSGSSGSGSGSGSSGSGGSFSGFPSLGSGSSPNPSALPSPSPPSLVQPSHSGSGSASPAPNPSPSPPEPSNWPSPHSSRLPSLPPSSSSSAFSGTSPPASSGSQESFCCAGCIQNVGVCGMGIFGFLICPTEGPHIINCNSTGTFLKSRGFSSTSGGPLGVIWFSTIEWVSCFPCSQGMATDGPCAGIGGVSDCGQSPTFISGNEAQFSMGSSGSFTVATFSTSPVSSISEAGKLPNGLTFTDNGNGNATLSGTPLFPITKTHWPITITATNGTGVSHQKFTIIVHIDHLEVKEYPTPHKAGDSAVYKVEAHTKEGRIDTSFNTTLVFFSNDPKAILPPPSPIVGGVGFYNATFKTLGKNRTVKAATTDGKIKGIQKQIIITAGTAVRLVVTGYPSPHLAGNVGTFKVQAIDGSDNRDVNYTGTVEFSATDLFAALPPITTFNTHNRGVRTFTTTFNTIGNQTLTATDISDPTITGAQSGIIIFSNVAHKMKITYNPDCSVTVTVLDKAGNVVKDYAGTVTFSGNGTLPSDYTFVPGDMGVHTFPPVGGTGTLKVSDTLSCNIKGIAPTCIP